MATKQDNALRKAGKVQIMLGCLDPNSGVERKYLFHDLDHCQRMRSAIEMATHTDIFCETYDDITEYEGFVFRNGESLLSILERNTRRV